MEELNEICELEVCLEKAKEALKQVKDILDEIEKQNKANWEITCGKYKLTINIEKVQNREGVK